MKLNDIINNPTLYSKSSILTFFSGLQSNISLYEDSYKAYLGENYFGFKTVANNINILNNIKFGVARETKIYSNFINLYDSLPTGLYYVNYGRSHILQKYSTVEDFESFVAQLKNQTTLSMISIGFVYNNSISRFSNHTQTVSELNSELHLFEVIEKTEAVLIKLNGEDSPFDKELLWPTNREFELPYPFEEVEETTNVDDDKTTDYFQYIIVISDSD